VKNKPKTMREVKEMYDRGANIMKLFHELEPGATNSLRAILTSYDLQSGSYIKFVTEHPDFVDNYMGTLARLLDGMAPASLLEAGVGEATTLVNVLARMTKVPAEAYGFDLAWSRIACGNEYAAAKKVSPHLFVGNVMEIPIQDDSFDIVYTSHTIESNRGREQDILRELYRVARRYVVLLEPSNELGSEESKRHIEEFRYCRDLPRHAAELGYKVIEHRLYDYHWSQRNQTSLMIIEKGLDRQPGRTDFYACPACRHPLDLHKGNYYCRECFLVYPVIGGIPCLAAAHGILASKYLEKA
jgi:SAM-dependent methyltransferase